MQGKVPWGPGGVFRLWAFMDAVWGTVWPASPFVTTSKTDESDTEPTLTDGWHNRLILGDKRDILPALLPAFAERVNLIYIDPPFMTGRNFISYSDK